MDIKDSLTGIYAHFAAIVRLIDDTTCPTCNKEMEGEYRGIIYCEICNKNDHLEAHVDRLLGEKDAE